MGMTMRFFPALLIVAASLLGCPPIDPVVPPPTPPPDTDWCGTMCDHLKRLGCEEGKDVYDNDKPGPVDVPNQTCQAWCTELQDPSHVYFINPRCVTEVTSCDQIEAYRKKDPATCTTAVKE